MYVLEGNVRYAVARIDGPCGPIGTPLHTYCIYAENYHRPSWFYRHYSIGDINPRELDGLRCGYCNDDWQKGPKYIPPFPGKVARHCLSCPPKPTVFPLDKVIAVGFGGAEVTCDGKLVLDGEDAYHHLDSELTGTDAEALAAADPHHDWRIVLRGPMGGQVYQRHAPGEWVYVVRLPGFA